MKIVFQNYHPPYTKFRELPVGSVFNFADGTRPKDLVLLKNTKTSYFNFNTNETHITCSETMDIDVIHYTKATLFIDVDSN